MEISLCMIVRNEEGCLDACLQSVLGAVDEIVILDTGSTDGTKDIARKYTDRVYDYVWEDDFSAARNASLSLARKPYLLWLDADDVLDPPEREKLIALKRELNGEIDAVMMPYQYSSNRDGTPSLVFDRERIIRRDAGFSFSGVVHEAIAVRGNVIREEIVIRHTGEHGQRSSRRNLMLYERALKHGVEFAPRDRYYYARELKNAGEYERALEEFGAFLQEDGWAENRIDAHIQRGECCRLLGRYAQAHAAYFAALDEGEPRAEALCALGACLLEEGRLDSSALWYRAALLCPKPKEKGAFVSPDAYGYIPLMQLCVIYDRMGLTRLAAQMNEQALLLRPGDEHAHINRAYFADKLRKDGDGKKHPGKS
ncbi:MAG: glycosyltransferase family 2 protein [Clostridia bacterium]|nr:glycosyltransferase family 2 protein [Clostridia bacterium]